MVETNVAKGIVRREAALCGLDRIATLARNPSVYQAAIDADVSREALWVEIQIEAKAYLESLT